MRKFYVYLLVSLIAISCIDKGEVYNEISYSGYQYPSGDEVSNVIAEITIVVDDNVSYNLDGIEIPPLKYNKSWLFMLTQDDCKQAAYCRTWAAINGRPVSPSSDSANYYYDVENLIAGDLPPLCYELNKTLGSSDGCGNEVRFHFTTTLAPEWSFMRAPSSVRKGYRKNYYRFYMKSGLRWANVKEMLNFGTGIAFHDVNTTSVDRADSILFHYRAAQDSIVKNLSGRGAKMLAEPNGNKTYVTAANTFEDIQTMVAQTGAKQLYPFKESSDISKVLLARFFSDDPNSIKPVIESELKLPREERKALHVGVHNTDNKWVDFLLWLNNTYGKDGDDSVWFPSQEEYYEYNYYRTHAQISKTVNGNSIKITIKLPSEKYFYYPSLTLNLPIENKYIRSVTVNDIVTGMSYSGFGSSTMINIDCRKHLLDHATHYVEAYENNPTSANLIDAKYFINQLKESTSKSNLSARISIK